MAQNIGNKKNFTKMTDTSIRGFRDEIGTKIKASVSHLCKVFVISYIFDRPLCVRSLSTKSFLF
jgi:hypothetical protein